MDYEKTYAPVAKYSSIREIMSLVSVMGWRTHQMDVKTTFLNMIFDPQTDSLIVQGSQSASLGKLRTSPLSPY